jgi:hypothetical protein
VFGCSLYEAAMVVARFTNDARDAAGQWIVAHVPAGSSILVAGNGPSLPLGRYQVRRPIRMELCGKAMEPRTRLERSSRYQAFRDRLFDLEHWLAARLGTHPQRKPYHAWFDWYVEQCEAPNRGDPDPDFVVVVGDARVRDLSGEELQVTYRMVNHVEYRPSGASGPYMNFVNLPVTIYARDASSRERIPPTTRP